MDIFRLNLTFCHVLNAPCLLELSALHALFGTPVPSHPNTPHFTFYPVNSHLSFRTKMTDDLLLSTFLDSLRAHSCELTPNFAHYPYSHAHKVALQYVMFAYMPISPSRQ